MVLVVGSTGGGCGGGDGWPLLDVVVVVDTAGGGDGGGGDGWPLLDVVVVDTAGGGGGADGGHYWRWWCCLALLEVVVVVDTS